MWQETGHPLRRCQEELWELAMLLVPIQLQTRQVVHSYQQPPRMEETAAMRGTLS